MFTKQKYSETSVCSLFCLFALLGEFVLKFGSVFAIPFEVLSLERQDEIHHCAGWEWGGGLRGTKSVNGQFVKKLAFPKHAPSETMIDILRVWPSAAESLCVHKLAHNMTLRELPTF